MYSLKMELCDGDSVLLAVWSREGEPASAVQA